MLVQHGFTGSPYAMRPWGEHLAAHGFRVVVPRLPGHGTSWRELNVTGWQDWYACAERALLGIGDNLIRLSVGVEEEEDLVADVEQALEAALAISTPSLSPSPSPSPSP